MDWDLVLRAFLSLVMIAFIGGVILLAPLGSKLGQLLEIYIQEKKGARRTDPKAVEELAARMSAVEERLHGLAERQEFLDRLLADREPRERVAPERRSSR